MHRCPTESPVERPTACPPRDARRSQRRWLAAAAVLAGVFVLYVHTTQSRHADQRFHGDAYMDLKVSLWAQNLNTYGFRNMRMGMPQDDGPALGLDPVFNVNHPRGYVWALTALKRWGVTDLYARLLPLAVSASALVGLFLLVRRALGDSRIAFAAALAMALAAPYRILADSFSLQSYCFAARVWLLLVIVYAATAPADRQRRGLILCGLVAFLSISLVAYEVVPGAALFAVAFPLLLGEGGGKQRFCRAVKISLCVGGGFVLGMGFLLLHSSLLAGGLEPVVDLFVRNYRHRAATNYGEAYWGRAFISEISYRIGSYYNVHLVVTAVGLVAVGLLGLTGRSVRLIGVLLAADILWIALFRQHSHLHVHTISHLVVSLGVMPAVVLVALWQRLSDVRWARGVLCIAVAAAAIIALSDYTATAYGNIAKAGEYYQGRQRDADKLSQYLPPNAVLIVQTGFFTDPSAEYFIRRLYLRRPDALDQPLPEWAHPFLLTSSEFAPERHQEALERYALVAVATHWHLFDMRLPAVPATTRTAEINHSAEH